jgi:hypothetical protein
MYRTSVGCGLAVKIRAAMMPATGVKMMLRKMMVDAWLGENPDAFSIHQNSAASTMTAPKNAAIASNTVVVFSMPQF